MASILVFDINKKYLLYKILNEDILKLLINELYKKYGENVQQVLSPIPENKQVDTETETEFQQPIQSASKIQNLLTDDFIYGYFAPIVNSFEISKEMNYVYEYALFNKNEFIIRFTLYDNCLLLCIYNSLNIIKNQQQKIIPTYFKPSNASSTTLSPESLELNKLIHNDYYTNWCSKSIISLIKYKFGICSDERCFNEIDNELKYLFLKWSKYHSADIIYFIETIEYLQVNEETKFKCDLFLKEFIDFINEQEQIKLEFDYIEDESLTNNIDDDDDDANNFPGQNIKDSNQYYDEIEDFFDDVGRINYCILNYGSKMLFKHDVNLNNNLSGDVEFLNRATNVINNSGNSTQTLDASSLFLILLEAASFLNYNIQDPFLDESINSSFKSPTSTPSPVSIEDTNENNLSIKGLQIRDENNNNNNKINNKSRNSNIDSFKSIKTASTPMLGQTTGSSPSFKTPIDEFKITNEEIENEITNALNQSKLIDNNNKIINYKKTHCFLRNSNKSYNFYDVLFIKLDTNLCLTLLKLSKLTKYCELITDLDTYLNEFLIILNKKRLILTNIESESKNNIKNDEKPITVEQRQQDESDEMKFLSVFINKLISFYEKMQILKNELNVQLQTNFKSAKPTNISSSLSSLSSSSSSTLKSSTLNRKNIFNKLNLLKQQRYKITTRRSSYIKNKSSQMKTLIETQLKQQIKLANNLQIKINQLIKNKQFIPSLNIQATLASLTINQLLNNYQNIETQIIQLKVTLKDLLFDLFLNEKFTLSKSKDDQQLMQAVTPSTSTSSSTPSSIFQLNSFNFMNSVKNIFKKNNLNLYTSFMDVKMKRNLAMSYYWHQFPGLIHFSFINRYDNNCIIPTIETCVEYDISELKINLAYRKYLPIITTFLYKHDCTQFQFIDSSLGIVINYFIWFEDKNANYIPVDLNTNKQKLNLTTNNNNNNNNNNSRILNRQVFSNIGAGSNNSSNSSNSSNSKTNYFNIEHKTHNFPIGITLDSYYDLLRKLCYPNAPNDSLSCYELICLHSIKLNEKNISDQCGSLAILISQTSKRNNK